MSGSAYSGLADKMVREGRLRPGLTDFQKRYAVGKFFKRIYSAAARATAAKIANDFAQIQPSVGLEFSGSPRHGDIVTLAIGETELVFRVTDETNAGIIALRVADRIRSDKDLGAVIARRTINIPGVFRRNEVGDLIQFPSQQIEVQTPFVAPELLPSNNPEIAHISLTAGAVGIEGCLKIVVEVTNVSGSTLQVTATDPEFTFPGVTIALKTARVLASGGGVWILREGEPIVVNNHGDLAFLRSEGYVQ
jgi:hypothetical protein